MKDFELSDEQREKLAKQIAELTLQAEIFDLDIDWETLTLVPRDNYVEPFWLTRWKEKPEDDKKDGGWA